MTNVLINKERENTVDHLKSLLDESAQLELSISLANFFSNDNIKTICEEVLSTHIPLHRDISEAEVSLYKFVKNFNAEEFEIKDILLLHHYPPTRYIEITTRLNSTLDYNRFRYNYNPNIYGILNKVVSDAYNFNTYCLSSLTTYTVKKKLLYINFAKEVAKILNGNYTAIVDFKYIINNLLEHKLFTNKDRFIKVFNITHSIQIEITTITNNVIKLSVNNKQERVYIYLDRHLKGLAQLKLIFELIIKELYP